MLWISILAKTNRKHPENARNNLLKNKKVLISKCELKGAEFIHLTWHGAARPSAHSQLRHWWELS